MAEEGILKVALGGYILVDGSTEEFFLFPPTKLRSAGILLLPMNWLAESEICIIGFEYLLLFNGLASLGV